MISLPTPSPAIAAIVNVRIEVSNLLYEMKKPPRKGGFHCKPGDFLLSHTLARAVPSGLRSLTAVFGKGTGGSSSLGSPRNWRIQESGDRSQNGRRRRSLF